MYGFSEYEKSAPHTSIFENPAFSAKSRAAIVTVPAPVRMNGNAVPVLRSEKSDA